MVRFYPIAGTLAWASQHEPITPDVHTVLPETWDALLLPFVEGSYPQELYPVNLMSVDVRPSDASRARVASLGMINRGAGPVGSAEEAGSQSVVGSHRHQPN